MGIQGAIQRMNDRGKSDRRVVPKKRANKGRGAPRRAECVEERRLAKGNPATSNSGRTQSRKAELRSALDRIRKVAERDREVKFTSLWHHVYDIDRLEEAYFSLKRSAAVGVDDVTWEQYGEDLMPRLEDLSARLRRGAYRPKPAKRIYIPKPDGRRRPIGILALEDKIVQRATVEVLNAIYEADFMDFSYGFRPKRSQHMALNAVWVGIKRRRVNWVLDADIQGFFDTIDHEMLVKFVEHRIADQRVVRHIKKWLHAGVLEDEEWRCEDDGTPQGGSISPLLANIYLHYALDLWVQHKRTTESHGDVIMVRYADDFVMGFEHRATAEQLQGELRARLAKFRLQLHPTKTRLLEFGRYAQQNRARRGEGRPEAFDFLGFTHYCARTQKGWFTIKRQTRSRRMKAKLAEVKATLRAWMHAPIPVVGKWVGEMLRGHYQYYGVPGNFRAMWNFRYQVIRRWRQVLRRRSQRGAVAWEHLQRYIDRYVPNPRIRHPWPDQCLRV